MVDDKEADEKKEDEKKDVNIKRSNSPFKRDEKVQRKHRLMDEEIQIKINPRMLLKGFLFITLLVAVFFLGRVSTEISPSSLGNGISGMATSDLEEITEEVELEAVEEPEVVAEEEAEESEVAEEEEEETEEPAAEEEEEEEEIDEPIVTTYGKVALAINDVTRSWKGTWGKITQVEFTIKNNEAGTVVPNKLIMFVEGYDDYEKEITFTTEVRSGQSEKQVVNVPKGFAYNEQSTGDLEDVEILLVLADDDDKEMARFRKSFDLSG